MTAFCVPVNQPAIPDGSSIIYMRGDFRVLELRDGSVRVERIDGEDVRVIHVV